ncbi:hypothetical protein [Hymenobacter terricola]|uniref:hypothetical protein n=1 Tax=Hymenobacter terricola TaxID=2819236 RepID=UPI001B30B318|nr:hypothetical protein [Hymenobacter terricola]
MFLQSSTRGLGIVALSAVLLAGPAAKAQMHSLAAAPMAKAPARREHRLWLKAGLRLSHFAYAFGPRGRVLVLPISVGAEYRLTSQFSLYGQAEADVMGRGGRRGGAAPAQGNDAALGLRYYYRHLRPLDSLRVRPFARDYLALEGNADFAGGTGGRRGRGITLSFTPALYGFWGTQHRWATLPLLFDFNAGLGVQVLSRYGPDRAAISRLDVAAQVNMRLYFRR